LESSLKAKYLLSEFARLSKPLGILFYASLKITNDEFIGPRKLTFSMAPQGAAFTTFDKLAERLKQPARNRAFFVHELLPHYPYAFDANCQLKEKSEWQSLVAAPKAVRQAGYVDQVRCALVQIKKVVDAADQDTLFIIQGDHGSRIATNAVIERLRRLVPEDFIATHSTLFVVRSPGISPGYETAPVQIASILKRLTQSGFADPLPAQDDNAIPFVKLTDSTWRPVMSVPLPKDWIHAIPQSTGVLWARYKLTGLSPKYSFQTTGGD
jgi:hypothetical protein